MIRGGLRICTRSCSASASTSSNVQKRLTALHHLDAPWKPAEVEQREGRILRQGNDNSQVAIYRYVTEGSFDAFMWQALETKARFIAQVMTGDSAVRRADDIGGQELSYAEVKAIASGNPAVLTLAEADAEIKRLVVLKRNHADEQFLMRRKLRELPQTIERLRDRRIALQIDQTTMAAHAEDPLFVDDRACLLDEVSTQLGQRLESLPIRVAQRTRTLIGQFRGLVFGLIQYPSFHPELFLEGALSRTTSFGRDHVGPRAVLNALEQLAGSYAREYESAGQELVLAEGQLRDYDARLGKSFEQEDYLVELERVRDALKDVLSGRATADQEPGSSAAAFAEQIKRLQAGHAGEPEARRSVPERVSIAEEPITTRVRRRIQLLGLGPTTAE